LFSFIQ